MSRDVIARVLGHAMIDEGFAEKLHKNPAEASQSLGIHLTSEQASALKKIDLSQVRTVGGAIRNKLGPVAFIDQNQNQVQARMD